jgi:hypothetical protein
MLFSGGAAGEDVVVGVVVVVVVEVSGAFCFSLVHDAVKPTIATIATPPATAARRRANRDDSMLFPVFMCMCPRLPIFDER